MDMQNTPEAKKEKENQGGNRLTQVYLENDS